ncbi:TetR family transcriptional regulator [Rhodococcus sp. 06-621-2]|nr:MULTISPECIES: TetR/AcrR family transcriptional regulator [unclassified Rhodococcus (in: high G+C Gram-positive bacteria)]OZC48085.1 TetR family transcriptional regulator [Rhodococcus sp. 06-621-2]OZF06167.1 TetR family transcriptional regulator [Rhodococcus sp. 15-1154-1]
MPDTSKTGRPRDPDLERRVFDAAVDIFGTQGWAKFSIEAVARQASVGKASIYLRWPNKNTLLQDAIEDRITVVATQDSGDIKADLLELARQTMRLYLGGAGRAIFRMAIEGDSIPGVTDQFALFRDSQTLAAREMVRKAIARGELPADTSVTLLLETLLGAIILHTLSTPKELDDAVRAHSEEYARDLVDHVLRTTR